MNPEKPSYSTSKRHLLYSSVLPWTVILLCAIGALMGKPEAVAFGTIAVPSMVALIAAMLGIHRISGSMDFRASNLPRDQPGGES
ncbi:NAD(P)+ transhydrogenase beta chain [Shinella sp.]|uniref:NAD(P)+ transhydrogenase beta chain n=1 Tax=Shinella sp. TaxID=1870904 RepID=UPI0029BC2641|nr:NAD(P)+ transhydrogenase beta chain [Shinella sp.]MDX3977168.1 NAD(P)+ transhydrogenase beta chain [Shinella sp.]